MLSRLLEAYSPRPRWTIWSSGGTRLGICFVLTGISHHARVIFRFVSSEFWPNVPMGTHGVANETMFITGRIQLFRSSLRDSKGVILFFSLGTRTHESSTGVSAE
jgi:hypothetical protein